MNCFIFLVIFEDVCVGREEEERELEIDRWIYTICIHKCPLDFFHGLQPMPM